MLVILPLNDPRRRMPGLRMLTLNNNTSTMSSVAAKLRTGEDTVRFGEKVRALRKAKNLPQRTLAKRLGVSFTYLSKIENENLDFGDYPSEHLILRIAQELDGDADELLILAKKVPPRIRERVFERPEMFLRFASLDDRAMERLMAKIDA